MSGKMKLMDDNFS